MATIEAGLASPEQLEEAWHEDPGLGSFLTTVDHKRIGKRYLYTGLLFLVLGGVESLFMRLQLAHSNLHVLDPETYNQLFTMHGVTMMFLFATPVLSGFGNYLVPLMIGARDMAFPRLNAFGYWVFLGAGVFFYSSFVIHKLPDAGWFNYTPLSDSVYSIGPNVDFYALGLIFMGISTTAGSINFIVTILKMRAPGMSLDRMPIFVWGELAMALTVVFALPALTLANFLLELERRAGFHFFAAEHGGQPLLWQHLFWIFGHPEVYLVVLPALGIASAIIPTMCRRPMIGYTYIVLAEMAIALISFGVWVHHMFATGLPTIGLGFISLTSFLVVIPSGVQIFAWLATLWAGKPMLKTPMLFILGFIVLFVIGGLSGPMLAAIPLDQQVTDTYFVVAHFHYVLVGGAMFPIFAGIYFWAPKMTGRLLHEGWGKVSFWTMFIGFNALFFPMHILGLRGQPRRMYTYQPGHGWDSLNLLETIGAFVLALGILITFINWVWSAKRGKEAGHDPWRGETLEWATTSPPAEYNFENIPTIRSREPMWDQPELGAHGQPVEAGGRGLGGGHNTLCTSLLEAEPEVVVPMPHESPWPLLLTITLFFVFLGLVIRSPFFWGVAAVAGVVSTAGWFWPRNQTQET